MLLQFVSSSPVGYLSTVRNGIDQCLDFFPIYRVLGHKAVSPSLKSGIAVFLRIVTGEDCDEDTRITGLYFLGEMETVFSG